MNNLLRFFIVIAIIASVFTSSCDSLWKVQETGTVSFTISIDEILAKNAYDPTMSNIRTIDGGDDLENNTVIVSLHKDSDDSLIAEQKTPLSGSINEINATFKNLRVGLHLYAKIIILDDKGIAFSARSESIKVKARNNYLVARTNAIFLDPAGNDAKDENNGLTPDTAVKSLARAVELLGSSGDYIKGATVYLMNSLEIHEDTTWTYGNIIIKRYGIDDFPMIDITNADTVFNLGGATLDGNSIGLGIYTNSLSLTAQNGTITNTDIAISEDGDLVIEHTFKDMRISDNRIAMTAKAINLAGGAIIIRDNTEKNVVAATITITENLSNTTLIGLTLPQDIPVGTQLASAYSVSANDIKINPLNFFIDGYGAGEHLDVVDNALIYKPGAMPETTFYVGGANSQYSSVQEAVNVITGINTGAKTYTIIVNGTIIEEGPTADTSGNTTDDAMVEIESPDTPLYLTIKGENNATIDAGTRFTIDEVGQVTVTIPGKQKRVFYISGDASGSNNVHISLENVIVTGGHKIDATSAYGGGVYIENAKLTLNGTSNITRNLVYRDSESQPSYGGGIASENSTIEMNNTSSVTNNISSGTLNASDYGISYAGGIYAESSNIYMNNASSVIGNETITEGGGIYIKNESSLTRTLSIRGGTITGNQVSNTNGSGAGISFDNTNNSVAFEVQGNTIIYDNVLSSNDTQTNISSGDTVISINDNLDSTSKIGINANDFYAGMIIAKSGNSRELDNTAANAFIDESTGNKISNDYETELIQNGQTLRIPPTIYVSETSNNNYASGLRTSPIKELQYAFNKVDSLNSTDPGSETFTIVVSGEATLDSYNNGGYPYGQQPDGLLEIETDQALNLIIKGDVNNHGVITSKNLTGDNRRAIYVSDTSNLDNTTPVNVTLGEYLTITETPTGVSAIEVQNATLTMDGVKVVNNAEDFKPIYIQSSTLYLQGDTIIFNNNTDGGISQQEGLIYITGDLTASPIPWQGNSVHSGVIDFGTGEFLIIAGENHLITQKEIDIINWGERNLPLIVFDSFDINTPPLQEDVSTDNIGVAVMNY